MWVLHTHIQIQAALGEECIYIFLFSFFFLVFYLRSLARLGANVLSGPLLSRFTGELLPRLHGVRLNLHGDSGIGRPWGAQGQLGANSWSVGLHFGIVLESFGRLFDSFLEVGGIREN